MWQRVGTWRVLFAEPESGRSDDGLRAILDALACGDAPPGSEPIKRSRVREVLRAPDGRGGHVFVKHDSGRRSWSRRSRAHQEFLNLQRVRARGIDCVEPVLCAERGADSLLITRELAGALVLSEALRSQTEAARSALLGTVGALARRLHDAGLWHRDLHRGNLLVVDRVIHLVDLQKMRALPVPVPRRLRISDLAMVTGRDTALLAGYTGGSGSAALVRRVARASERRKRRRLRSRGRRCVVDSSGFRQERIERLQLWRRTDVDARVVLDAWEAARGAQPGGITRIAHARAGPEPGPAPSPFARGHGGDCGTPADAPIEVLCLEGAAGPWPLRSAGMRAWRNAHAALLRGLDVPAPLALIEERGIWGARRSWLVRRAERATPLVNVLSDRSRRDAVLPELARLVARLHAARVDYALDVTQLSVRDPEGTALPSHADALSIPARGTPALVDLVRSITRTAPDLDRAELARALRPAVDDEDLHAAWRAAFGSG